MTSFRRALILLHRTLAVFLSVPVLVWFVSGIAMIYAGGMPRLTPAARLRGLTPIDLSMIRIGPGDAQLRIGRSIARGRVVLVAILGRPAYQFDGPSVVFADTGETLGPVDATAAARIAASFLNVASERLRYVRELHDADQWTVGQRLAMPLHKLAMDDERGTEVYVSAGLGEVVLVTDRRSRGLAWVAAIPHWWYVTALRRHAGVWRQLVLWASALAAIVAVAGVGLALAQARTRYVGLMRWHYRAGAAFGLFAVTWLVSGWLSLQPWDWASPRDAASAIDAALTTSPLDLRIFPVPNPDRWRRAAGPLTTDAVKEIELIQIDGAPHYALRANMATPLVIDAHTLELREPFRPEQLLARLERTLPGIHVANLVRLIDYDLYYYDRDGQMTLPVERVALTDADRTWLYIDSSTGAIAARFTRRQRIERWAYHGMHSLDFPFLYRQRPLWDVAVILLCSGGAFLSVIGTILAWRRARRWRLFHLAK